MREQIKMNMYLIAFIAFMLLDLSGLYYCVYALVGEYNNKENNPLNR